MPPGDLITAVTASFGAQYEYAATLFGTGTKLIVDSIEGLDSMPDLSTDDTDRNDDHGTLPGLDLMKARDITMTVDINGDNHADVMAIYRILARIMRPVTVDVPFVFQRPNEVKKQCFVRSRKRSFPSDAEVAAGYKQGMLNWLAGDPRIYSLVEHHTQIVLAAGVSGGNVVVNNAGDFHAYPRFVLSGGGSNPRIAVSGQTVDSLDGTNFNGRTTALDLLMVAADVLDIRPKTRAILLNGANAYQYKRADNQWWELMPGNNTIEFDRTVNNSQQILDIYWYDAWI